MSAFATKCPSCGGPIEFKLGSSNALICPWCRASVLRSDRDVRNLGIVADLVPTSPDLNVGDRATIFGREIVVGGRLQLDHGRGPWDEWYIEQTASGQWAWLAKAQGHWYFSEPVQPPAPIPAWEHLGPGQRGAIPGLQGQWVVAERGQSRLLSAEGELPFGAVPGETGRFVDLSGENGGFASLDYGDGSEPPRLYAGRRLEAGEISGISGGTTAMGAGPASAPKEAQRLRCPTCGSPVDIHVPESTERAACGHCNTLLDYSQGRLQALRQLEQARAEPDIPLGTSGTIAGEKVTVIGYMVRSTRIDFVVYSWREYLLHSAEKGYLWLVEDNGHFVLVRPIDAGAVKQSMPVVRYDGKRFVRFATAQAVVEKVVGEFYWRVERGEEAYLEDYTAPPRVVSMERTQTEQSWSVGEHVDAKEVWKGLGLTTRPPTQRGVGIVQPNPHRLAPGCAVGGLAAAALMAMAVGFTASHPKSVAVEGALQMPPTSGAAPDQSGAYAMMTPPFSIPGGPQVVRVELDTNASNQYVGANCALVNQATNEAVQFYVDAGQYSGVSGGESWSEGSQSGSTYVDELPAGDYVLRVDPFWTSFPQPGGPPGMYTPQASIRVERNERSPFTFMVALLLLLLPVGLIFARHHGFETKRKENSNLS